MNRDTEGIERKRQLSRLRSQNYRERNRLRIANEHRRVCDVSSAATSSDEGVSGVPRQSDNASDFSGASGSSDGRGSFFMNVDQLEPENLNITPNLSGNDENNCSVGISDESDCEDNEEERDIREASMDEDESEELSEADNYNGIEALRDWALRANLAHTRLEELLAILNILKKDDIPDLPKCAKTFLGTSKVSYKVQKFNEQLGSEYVYFGMVKTLEKSINPELHEEDLIHLIVNVDGMQLFKSSSKQFWPIMCKIHHDVDVYKPFPAAIYSGNQKPDDIQKFLDDFIDEINILNENGIQVGDRIFKICIKAFVCDTPARALLKCVKGHGGYSSCERCTIFGIREERRTIYPDVDSEPRTDESFRQKRHPEHHKGTSPLLSIKPPMNIIFSFLLDFMHLCCLGVMKKMLDFWLHSRSMIKVSQNSKNILSTLLIRLQGQIPAEFQRTTRSLSDVDKFKAVEFRFLLLYAGPVIFKRVLPETVYKHFLLLHTACRILCSKALAVRYRHHAKYFLKKFVETAAGLYGRLFMIGNIHNLLHLADDVEYMRCSLSIITAFPFENALGKIKKLLRSGHRPLSQVCRRLGEIFLADVRRPVIPQNVQILRQLQPDMSGKTPIKRLQYNGVILTHKSPDNTVLLTNGTILEINDIHIPPHKDQNYIEISGKTLRIKKPLFTYPCNSDDLKMWAVTRSNSIPMSCKLSKVEQKMVTLDISEMDREKIYTMPLLHM